jgi:SagB-type dehydrogenase family enzyme
MKTKTKLQLELIISSLILVVSFIATTLEFFPIEYRSLDLPMPVLKGQIPLSSAIHQSKVTRNLTAHDIKLNDVAQLLWAFQGITHGPGFRSAPSAGATYPLKIFLLQRSSLPLKEGCSRYNPHIHKLSTIFSSYNESKLLSALSIEDRETVLDVNSIFLILADYERTTIRYGERRGIQYVHLEVGHAIQNFLLQSTALNLDTWIIANFNSQKIKNFLNTTFQPLVILPIGTDNNFNPALLRINGVETRSDEEITVEEAIAKRKSVRDYQQGKIPLSIVTNVLNDSVTINHIHANSSFFDLRLVVGEIDGLSIGMYQYCLENYTLNQYTHNDNRTTLKAASLDQPWVESAQLDIVFSVNTHWVNQQPDPNLYHRILMYNVGMMAQNVYLKCVAHGLGTVVVGAFDDWKVARLLNLSSSHSPIYVMPIGLTPEFFETRTELSIPLTEMARLIGLSLFIFFYLSLYLTLPIIKHRMKKMTRWIHCIFGGITSLGVIFHYIIIHGHIQSLLGFLDIRSYLSAVFYFIIRFLTLPTTRYELGMLFANLSLLFGIVTYIFGVVIAFNLVKKQKLLRPIHKYIIFITITLVILHNFLNGTFFAPKPILFLSLNIIALDLYFLIKISYELVKVGRKQQISIQ